MYFDFYYHRIMMIAILFFLDFLFQSFLFGGFFDNPPSNRSA